jgi:hypothetical protein
MEVREMFMTWLIALAILVAVLLILAAVAPRTGREDRPPTDRNANPSRPDAAPREAPKAA